MRIPRWDYMPVKGSPNKYHKPLFHYRYISLAAFLLLFIAFIIFFLVTLSVPIIKTIFLLELKAAQNPKQPPTSIANTITLGVWGLCAESALDTPGHPGHCIGPQLGFNVPQDTIQQASLIGVNPSLLSTLLNTLVVLLVLHPIAAVFSFITLVNSLFLGSHAVSIAALIFSIITVLLSTFVFAVDMAVVIIGEGEAKKITMGQFSVAWGPAIWMVFVATIFTWVAMGFLAARACFCCGVRRKKDPQPDQHSIPLTIYEQY